MKKIKSKPNKISYYDAESDVFYVGLKKGEEEEFVEVAPGINVELDRKKEIIGIEFLNASKVFQPISRILKVKSPLQIQKFSLIS